MLIIQGAWFDVYENPFVFKRFYNEVTYYGETMRQIREYEEVFEDKLEDDVKIQLLGY